MKSARAVDYLTHMVEAIDGIAMYTAGLTPEAFLQTTLVQDAVVRNFEIISEAARNVAREAPGREHPIHRGGHRHWVLSSCPFQPAPGLAVV